MPFKQNNYRKIIQKRNNKENNKLTRLLLKSKVYSLTEKVSRKNRYYLTTNSIPIYTRKIY